MRNQSVLFTTAQFAKLHGLNKRTLHYYDKIGLFMPRHKGENQYRYYDYAQSMELETIRMLKELNMSIAEIKQYLSNPDPEDFVRIADVKISEIDSEIRRLKRTKSILERKKQQLALCDTFKDQEILILECKEEYLLTTAYDFTDDDVETILGHLKQAWDAEQYRVGCGSFISVDKLKSGDFEHYDGLFTPVKKNSKRRNRMLKPGGTYLCGFVKGDWGHLKELYENMFAYAGTHRLSLTGYAYEIGLNEFAISSMKDYVTQVTIKITEA